MSKQESKLGVGILACVLVMLVAAVAGVSSPAQAGTKVTLSVVYFYTSEAAKVMVQKMLEEYQQQNPDISLDIQVVTQAKWPEVMTTRAIAKQLPDVAMAVPQRIGQWAKAGLLQDGKARIPRDVFEKFDPVRVLGDIYEGQVVGLPLNSSVRAVAYNADYFAKAGIVPPKRASEAWSWDQLVDAAKKARAASGARYALQFEKPSFDGWLPFLYQAGGQLLSDDGNKAAIDSPQARRALEWTLKLHKDGTAAPGMFEGTEDPLRLFASGMSAMWLATGNWMMDALEPQMKFKYSFTFLPKDVQHATVVGGADWVVFKGNHPKEAWDLVLTLTGPKFMAQYNTLHTSIPPRSDVEARYAIKPELAPLFVEQSRLMPRNLAIQQLTPAYASGRDKLLQELGACLTGQQSVDQTLVAMEKILNESLRK
jgi:ABC-type glycerol-3-phosphate transport system substrate-binding protein